MDGDALIQTQIDNLELIARGKVRDLYAVDERHMLMVATDRLSAFDVVFAEPIPGKGRLLTEISNFWFARTRALIDNHLTDADPRDYVDETVYRQLQGRSNIVRRVETLPVEAIVRGYVIGSGWKDYQANGKICGIELPSGLAQAAELAEPIFTPSTKAVVGDHDVNVNFDAVADRIGTDLARQIRDSSLQLYRLAVDFALPRGLIIADTKFEFGLDDAGKLVLIDEILTPDSSRYWPAVDYRTGISPPSFDKQFVRDYLETLDWDKAPPPPPIPQTIVEQTRAKYRQLRDMLLA